MKPAEFANKFNSHGVVLGRAWREEAVVNGTDLGKVRIFKKFSQSKGHLNIADE